MAGRVELGWVRYGTGQSPKSIGINDRLTERQQNSHQGRRRFET